MNALEEFRQTGRAICAVALLGIGGLFVGASFDSDKPGIAAAQLGAGALSLTGGAALLRRRDWQEGGAFAPDKNTNETYTKIEDSIKYQDYLNKAKESGEKNLLRKGHFETPKGNTYRSKKPGM